MMYNCHDIEPLLSSYIDDQLNERERAAVVQHLSRCPACEELHQQLCTLQQQCAQLPLQPLPHTFQQQLHKKLSQTSPKAAFSLPRLAPYTALAAGLIIALFMGTGYYRQFNMTVPDAAPAYVHDVPLATAAPTPHPDGNKVVAPERADQPSPSKSPKGPTNNSTAKEVPPHAAQPPALAPPTIQEQQPIQQKIADDAPPDQSQARMLSGEGSPGEETVLPFAQTEQSEPSPSGAAPVNSSIASAFFSYSFSAPAQSDFADYVAENFHADRFEVTPQQLADLLALAAKEDISYDTQPAPEGAMAHSCVLVLQ